MGQTSHQASITACATQRSRCTSGHNLQALTIDYLILNIFQSVGEWSGCGQTNKPFGVCWIPAAVDIEYQMGCTERFSASLLRGRRGDDL